MAVRSLPTQRPTRRRALHSFWILVVVAVLAAGELSSALATSPGPVTGLRVAASGLILLGSLTLATRVMIALARSARRERT